MRNAINLEEQPARCNGSLERKVGRCPHLRLKFDFDEETVTCRACGNVWRDWVGEAEQAAGAGAGEAARTA